MSATAPVLKWLWAGVALILGSLGSLPAEAASPVVRHGTIQLDIGGFGPATSLNVDLATGRVFEVTRAFGLTPEHRVDYTATPVEIGALTAAMDQLKAGELDIDACYKAGVIKEVAHSTALVAISGTAQDTRAMVPSCRTLGAERFLLELTKLGAAVRASAVRSATKN